MIFIYKIRHTNGNFLTTFLYNSTTLSPCYKQLHAQHEVHKEAWWAKQCLHEVNVLRKRVNQNLERNASIEYSITKPFNCSSVRSRVNTTLNKAEKCPPNCSPQNRALQITLAQQFCKNNDSRQPRPQIPLFFFALRLQTTSAEELPHELPPSPTASISRSERVASWIMREMYSEARGEANRQIRPQIPHFLCFYALQPLRLKDTVQCIFKAPQRANSAPRQRALFKE